MAFPDQRDTLFKQPFFLQEYYEVKQVDIPQSELCVRVGLDPVSCQQINWFQAFGEKRFHPYFQAFVEKGPRPSLEVFLWNTKNFSYVMATKNGGVPCRIQINSLAPSTSTINLEDPLNRYFSW